MGAGEGAGAGGGLASEITRSTLEKKNEVESIYDKFKKVNHGCYSYSHNKCGLIIICVFQGEINHLD